MSMMIGLIKRAIEYLSLHLLRRIEIRYRLINSFILLSLLPLLITGYISYIESSKAIEEKTRIFSSELVKQVSKNVQLRMVQINDESGGLVLSNRVQQALTDANAHDNEKVQSAARLELTRALLEHYGSLDFINQKYLLDKNNKVVDAQVFAQLTQGVLRFVDQAPILHGRPYWSSYDNGVGQQSVGMLRAIISKSSNILIGSLFLVISPEHFSAIFDNVNLGSGTAIFILDASNGRVIIWQRGKPFSAGDEVADPAMIEKIAHSMMRSERSSFVSFSSKGQGKFLAAYTQIPDTSWFVVSTIPADNLTAEVQSVRNKVILISFMCFLLSISLAYIISRSISAPLEELVQKIRETGNDAIRMHAGGPDESAVQKRSARLKGALRKLTTIAKRLAPGHLSVQAGMRPKAEMVLSDLQEYLPRTDRHPQDDASHFVKSEGQDELGRLAQSFARMHDAIREKIDLIEAQNELLKKSDKLKEELNQSLEKRVEKRTEELGLANEMAESANRNLAEKNALLENMNIALRHNEDVLRKNEELLRETQIIAGLGAYVLNLSTGRWEGSDVLEKLLGINEAYEHSIEGWKALIHPDDRTLLVDYLEHEVLVQGKSFDREYRILRHDDQAVRWLHGFGKLEFDAQGRPLKILGAIQDITETREREAELAANRERLHDIEKHQALSRERQRLMQDMHDGLGSSLISALRVVERGQIKEADITQVLKGCIDDLKLAIDSMEPVDADLLLLLATLRFRLGPRLESTGIALRWDVKDVPALDWLDPRNALHILRILQETFTNIIKHTHATEIRVATRVENDDVIVTIADNGPGFSVENKLKSGGKGLSNQLRRAESIGAEISWNSNDAGTCMSLKLPIKGRQAIA